MNEVDMTDAIVSTGSVRYIAFQFDGDKGNAMQAVQELMPQLGALHAELLAASHRIEQSTVNGTSNRLTLSIRSDLWAEAAEVGLTVGDWLALWVRGGHIVEVQTYSLVVGEALFGPPAAPVIQIDEARKALRP